MIVNVAGAVEQERRFVRQNIFLTHYTPSIHRALPTAPAKRGITEPHFWTHLLDYQGCKPRKDRSSMLKGSCNVVSSISIFSDGKPSSEELSLKHKAKDDSKPTV